MKKLKQIIAQVKEEEKYNEADFNELLWQLICYSPKMPLRLQQENLMTEANKFSLKVMDNDFAGKELSFNGFSWGNGRRKILITHGWGSKAADLADIISALRLLDDVQLIAFDAPGNGSSEGELSNLPLYVEAVKAVIVKFGYPDITIGHSLGAMANVMALHQMSITPSLLISITPLIRLKENFEDSMNAAGVSKPTQSRFLESFHIKFHSPASRYKLTDLYPFDSKVDHWIAYDESDRISAYGYLKEFLAAHPSIKSQNYDGAGHERILKSAEMIADLVGVVTGKLN